MFKNPLKYQQGGQLNEQQQQKLAEFINWLPKRVKEFQGMEPSAIVQVLDGMSKTPEGQKQVQLLMEQFQQESQSGQSFRQGGKIHDFICTHAKGGALKGCGCKENGRNIEKHQNANGKIGVTNGKYQASDWENEFNQFTPTPGGGYARNYRLPMFGGHRWGIPGNTLRQVLVTYGDNGIPRKAVRDLEGYYGNGQIDTVIYDARGNKYNSPEFEARVNRELEGMDPHQRPTKKETGGNVEKAQNGTRSLYQQITADGPETYVDGYGTVREMNESPIITGLRKAYHWINMDRTLSDNAYSQKHGYSKPLTGMPPAVYVSPVAKEIELAKMIGNRIPTQKPSIRIIEDLGNGKFSAIDDAGRGLLYDSKLDKNLFNIVDDIKQIKPKFGTKTKRPEILDYDIDKIYSNHPLKVKTNNIASGIQMEAEHPVMLDYDIDKLPMFDSKFNIPDLNNIIKISWPKFIGRNVLLPASGAVGSAAAGSYVATKKDKNKKSENK